MRESQRGGFIGTDLARGLEMFSRFSRWISFGRVAFALWSLTKKARFSSWALGLYAKKFLSASKESPRGLSHNTLAQQGRRLARTGTHTGTPTDVLAPRRQASNRAKLRMSHLPRERDFDVLIFGASGYTGERVARTLSKWSMPGGAWATVRWAIAGRSQKKLDGMLGGLASPPTGVVIADTSDEASLRAMSARTHVLMNATGRTASTARRW